MSIYLQCILVKEQISMTPQKLDNENKTDLYGQILAAQNGYSSSLYLLSVLVFDT